MTVRVYRSTDSGAPILTGIAGSLLALLDACLVNGYGNIAITSLSQSGGVATAVLAANHGWVNTPKVVISGANESGYNGEVSATILSVNSFSFPVPPATAGVATGSLNVARPNCGWSKVFVNGSIAAFRQPTVGSNGFYLRVDDVTVGNISRLIGYETMTDASSGTGPFPTTVQASLGCYFMKSSSTDSVAKPWILITNGKMFYLISNQALASDWATSTVFAFGDFESFKSGDAYNTMICGQSATAATGTTFLNTVVSLSTAMAGHFCARSHTQLGTSILLSKGSDQFKGNGQVIMGTLGVTYPSPVDGALYTSPIFLAESTANILRGMLPGIHTPLHTRPLVHGDVWVPTGSLEGKTLECIQGYNAGEFFVEISDTW